MYDGLIVGLKNNSTIKQFDQMRKMMHKMSKMPGFAGGGAPAAMKPGFRRR
jgi:signal recognition particle subunit SRP54